MSNASLSKTMKYFFAAALALLLIVFIFGSAWGDSDIETGKVDTRDIADTLFDTYSFAFLVISILLFVALVGGIYLAKEEKGIEPDEEARK